MLISITSCNRLSEVKRYILPYIGYVQTCDNCDFLLALDGSNDDYRQFCDDYEIPLLYSEEREGVGLSKNRVIERFPDYDTYFFLDDDVELYDPSIFEDHTTFAAANTGYHHLSSTELWHILRKDNMNGVKVLFGNKGGGYFNFFTKKGLETVGGWHTDFAQWKRYGHTEHSYRFVNAHLQEYPFVVLADSIGKVIIHSPDHVSEPISDLVDPVDELFLHEKELIEKKITYFPVQTLSPYRFNGYNMSQPGNQKLVEIIESNDRYALLENAKVKRHAKAAFKMHELNQSTSFLQKIKLLLEIVFLAPSNNAFKHWIKQNLRRKNL
jgi:glycosyltransferase involved in cell wall biosynthesis